LPNSLSAFSLAPLWTCLRAVSRIFRLFAAKGARPEANQN
jgi:hypothetical protein